MIIMNYEQLSKHFDIAYCKYAPFVLLTNFVIVLSAEIKQNQGKTFVILCTVATPENIPHHYCSNTSTMWTSTAEGKFPRRRVYTDMYNNISPGSIRLHRIYPLAIMIQDVSRSFVKGVVGGWSTLSWGEKDTRNTGTAETNYLTQWILN